MIEKNKELNLNGLPFEGVIGNDIKLIEAIKALWEYSEYQSIIEGYQDTALKTKDLLEFANLIIQADSIGFIPYNFAGYNESCNMSNIEKAGRTFLYLNGFTAQFEEFCNSFGESFYSKYLEYEAIGRDLLINEDKEVGDYGLYFTNPGLNLSSYNRNDILEEAEIFLE